MDIFVYLRLQEVYQLQKKAKQGTSQKKDRDSNPVSASAGSINTGEPEEKVGYHQHHHHHHHLVFQYPNDINIKLSLCCIIKNLNRDTVSF